MLIVNSKLCFTSIGYMALSNRVAKVLLAWWCHFFNRSTIEMGYTFPQRLVQIFQMSNSTFRNQWFQPHLSVFFRKISMLFAEVNPFNL